MYARICRILGACLGIVLSAPAAGAQTNGSTPKSMASEAEQRTRLDLRVGEQTVLPSENVRSYSEGVRGIVDVRLTKDASEFILVALRPGTTTVLFLMLDGSQKYYEVTVVDPKAESEKVQQKPESKKKEDPGIRVEARDNVRLDFYFVQLQKNYFHQIGLGWPGTVAPTVNASYNLRTTHLDSATAVISNQALPSLDMAQASGWAKLMRQAAVVTANGEKAVFSGGGEVNIPVQTALASGLEKIAFGSVIEVAPRYDAKTGRIDLRLHADISDLDSDRGTGVPGRATSALDTVVNLELGQSLILAGLTARSQRASKSGLPLLSQIPLLGVFFGSHAAAEEETENVVVIVPSVVDAVSMQDRERVREALDHYAGYTGDLEDVDFIPEPKPHRPASKRRKAHSAWTRSP